jgi:hypothetical protein
MELVKFIVGWTVARLCVMLIERIRGNKDE